jgi:5-methylcytosine-specific restriction endonuclease McrA
MKIELKNITVRDLVEGYVDEQEEGVRGYGGKLDIRPAYQREFIYGEKLRNEVIHTVRRNFPLHTMYWAVSEDGFELMDGQQRTISICQYVAGDFSVLVDGNPAGFVNLPPDKKQQILDYELSIYVCEGTESEKLDWFKIINIAGLKLTDQELRNAIYTGPWLADAKKWFSKTGCPAYAIGEKYVNGSAIRQEILEKAIEWISADKVEDYMAAHQHDKDAQELWQHYQAVIGWAERIFPTYRRIMKGLDWGKFYREHKDDKLNAADLEKQIVALIEDDEVESKKGIYEYLLTGNEKALNLRAFSDKLKIAAYEKQKGICPVCTKQFEIGQMEADHIVPWSKGGKTVQENCQMLCMLHNRTKSGK